MLVFIIALGLVLTASGCATILDGTSQNVTFNSQPNGARIFLNGAPVGVTPLVTQVRRSKTTIVIAKKEGYQDQQMALQTKINTYFWGNFIFSGPFSTTTDYVSDAMIEYSPNMYFINLEPLQFSKPQIEQAQTERAPVGLSYERRIRNFILRNHVNLTSDIARGDGEYLSSLYSMLGLDRVRIRDHTKETQGSRVASFGGSVIRGSCPRSISTRRAILCEQASTRIKSS